MEKIKIEREIDVDTDRLFSNISSAIEYLQEIKDEYGDVDLEEKWYGYEDNYFCFTKFEEETDEEYKYRVKELKRKERERKKQKRKQELEAKKRAEIAEIHEKYRNL